MSKKNNVTRRSLTKRIRILEVVANLELLIVAIFVYIFNLGMFGIICDLIIYVGLSAYTYTLIKRCRCDKCGSTDVFEKRMGFTMGIADRCHHCNKKLANDKPLSSIHFNK